MVGCRSARAMCVCTCAWFVPFAASTAWHCGLRTVRLQAANIQPQSEQAQGHAGGAAAAPAGQRGGVRAITLPARRLLEGMHHLSMHHLSIPPVIRVSAMYNTTGPARTSCCLLGESCSVRPCYGVARTWIYRQAAYPGWLALSINCVSVCTCMECSIAEDARQGG